MPQILNFSTMKTMKIPLPLKIHTIYLVLVQQNQMNTRKQSNDHPKRWKNHTINQMVQILNSLIMKTMKIPLPMKIHTIYHVLVQQKHLYYTFKVTFLLI
uniref:Uncharacterized protein n=1 Tax=Cacopsylla melanoneura TaxID=428564 RepID=A0A8D8VBR2_9HEMI